MTKSIKYYCITIENPCAAPGETITLIEWVTNKQFQFKSKTPYINKGVIEITHEDANNQ